ncbi:MAG: SoxR reducing system RseC family protein [Methylococcales bacterium]|nr:SoxR reducing system RseC family protein [Methylococcales bacterium]
MIEALAIVVKIENHHVWVEAGSNNACSGCVQKASCSTNVLGNALKKKSLPVDSVIKLNAGDQVIVAIDENLLLRASLLLYIVPLLALFTGVGIAEWLVNNTQYADLWQVGSGCLSFLAALCLINKTQHRFILNYYARPIVVKKI